MFIEFSGNQFNCQLRNFCIRNSLARPSPVHVVYLCRQFLYVITFEDFSYSSSI